MIKAMFFKKNIHIHSRIDLREDEAGLPSTPGTGQTHIYLQAEIPLF